MNFSDLAFLSFLTPVESLWLFLAFYLIKWLWQNHKERENYELATKSFFEDFEHNTKNCVLTEPHEEPCRIAVVLLKLDSEKCMENFNKDGKDYWKRYNYLLKTSDSREFRRYYLELCEVYGIKNRSAFRKWLKEQGEKSTNNRVNEAKRENKNSDIWENHKLESKIDYLEYHEAMREDQNEYVKEMYEGYKLGVQ